MRRLLGELQLDSGFRSEMLPDLRLLISATVATFFLAAATGLYASLRVTQEQIAARADARAALEDNPIMRIANTWPLPEPGRAAALRDLARIPITVPITAPIVAASEPDAPVERNETEAMQEASQRDAPPEMPVPLPSEPALQVAVRESPAPDVDASTGIAAQPEPAPVVQTDHDHPDILGNEIDAAATELAKIRADKTTAAPSKKAKAPAKKTRNVQRRRKPAPSAPVNPFDQLLSGYPLYLTVPVTN